ncbi:MAG TPA: SRPBCC domain-containing protein [Trebonia sp.]|nr:SRPBCC domain-containing protein [Trebonia sp.]
MRIGSTLTIPAEPIQVFERFLDPDTMRACIPGCAELEQLDDEHYRGLLVNEIAHVRFSASFAAQITEIQPPSLVRAVLTGEDRKLGSSLKISATLRVAPEGGTSLVAYEMDIALWGRLGRLGEPVVRQRSIEVERQFSAAFADAVIGRTPAPAAPAAKPAASADGIASAAAVAAPAPPTPAPGEAAPAPGEAAPAIPASGRTGKPRLRRNILADILEHLARKLR